MADGARRIGIWPSLLAADLSDLARAAVRVGAAADGLHLDMMDGRFVPNLTMGPPVLAALRRHTELPLEAHLMVEDALALLPALRDGGATRVVVHVEATVHLQRALARIRELGMAAGAALNPATPPEVLAWVADDLDSVLVMTVNPGFGGQTAIPAAVQKIARVRAWARDIGRPDLPIGVDGGMDASTAPAAVRLGASEIVAGTAVFGGPDPRAAVRALRSACESGADEPVPGQA